MTHSQNEKFDPDLQEVAKFAKSLSHPARLAILEYLAKTSSCISGDISNEIPLGRSTVNQHLAELKKIGVIKGEIDGVKVNYCIDHKKLNTLILKLNSFFSLFIQTQQTDCKI